MHPHQKTLSHSYGIGGSSRKDFQYKQVEDLLLRVTVIDNMDPPPAMPSGLI